MKKLIFLLLLLPFFASSQTAIQRPIQGKVMAVPSGVVSLGIPLAQQNQTYTNPPLVVINQATFPMRSRWATYLPNGSGGYFQARSTGSMGIVLEDNPTGFNSNPIYYVSKNTANGKVEAVVNGSSYYTLDFDYTSFVYLRISVTPTQILFQFSNDDITYGHDQLIARVESGDLYVKTYYGTNGDTLTELKTFGFN